MLDGLKHFSEHQDLNGKHPSLELNSENNKKRLEKMKLESTPEIESEEAAFSESISHFVIETTNMN